MQYTQKPFRPLVTREQRVAVDTTIQTIALNSLRAGGTSVRVVNSGTNVTYMSITTGTDAGLTTANGFSLLPNTVECFWVSDEMTNVNFIGAASGNTVGVTVGEGS